MDFTGQITHISPLEEFTTKNGTSCLTRDIVLTTDERYPQSACFTLRNEMAKEFTHTIGEQLRIEYDIYAKASKDANRYFNQLYAWRITTC